LERLARQHKNFRVVRIDIDTWSSPVAEQYDIRSLPALWLFEGKKKRADDARAVFAFLQRD